MHVVQLIGALNPDGGGGGGELYGLRLAEAFAGRNVTSTLATVWWRATPAEERWAAQLARAGVQLLPGVAPGARVATDLLRAVRHLAPQLRRQRIDLLHSHVEYADLCALLLRLCGAVPRVLRTAHNPRECADKPPLAALSQLLYPLCFSAETAVSNEIADRLDRRPAARLIGRRAAMIANGVDAAAVVPMQSRAAVRAALGIDAATPLLICVARPAPQKGIDRLLAALARLRQELPAELLLVGSGPQQQALQQLALRHGVAPAVHWLGARSDVPDLLQAADLLVLASRWEGMPTVMLEAAWLGVPQLLADLPGTRQVLADGIHGRLVNAADADELAAAAAALLRDRPAARHMAAAARARVAAFTLQRAADDISGLYRRITAPD